PSNRIANHPTVVRFTVQSTSTVGLTNGLTGMLYVFRNGQQIPGSPLTSDPPPPSVRLSNGNRGPSSVLSVKSTYSEDERAVLQDSLNFYFGVSDGAAQIPQGQFTFALAIDPKTPAVRPAALSNNLNHDQILAHSEFDLFENQETYNFVTTRPLRILAIPDPRLSDPD